MSGTPPTSGCGGVVGSGVGGINAGTSSTAAAVAALATGAVPVASIGAASSADHFCLRWNNYQTNMTTVFDQLLQEEVFVDVTLSCEGGAQLRAHKVVLAACSPYFQSVLQHNPCKHPIIIMPRDVVFADLRAIIEFVYRGEIDVAQEQINSLLQAAEILKIKGLCEVSDDPGNMPPGFTAIPSTRSTQVNGQSTQPVLTTTTTNNNNNNTTSSISSSSSSSNGTTTTTVVPPSRGRPPLSRGRYSYRPRGRPPLYGRNRYDRPSLPTRASQGLRDQQPSKRIKTEMSDEDGNVAGGMATSSAPLPSSGCGMASIVTTTSPAMAGTNDMHRTHTGATGHYVQQDQHQQQHNDENTGGGVSHSAGSTAEYEAYYVKAEEQQQHQQQNQQQQQNHMTVTGPHIQGGDPNDPTGQRMTVTPELLGLMPSGTPQYTSDTDSLSGTPTGRKLWTDEDMDKALDSLRNSQMSLSRAAQVFGIPATTLWQRAHRMGIETPKKEGANKTWSEHDLAGALEELRSGRLSANRASKEFGIPNSTLYKIARKEGIKLSSPFSAIQPSWNPEDLNRALDAIRGGMSVQKSAQEFGIPTGTLYGRCRREGIELSKYQGVPWSEEDMKDALEVVRVGEMSINQAAIHYNLPYSSLYGRFKRGKYEDGLSHQDFLHQEMTIEQYSGDQLSVQSSNIQQSMQSQAVSMPQQSTPPPHQNSGQSLATSAPPDPY